MFKKFSILLILFAGVFWGSSPFFVNVLSSMGFDSLQNTAVRIIIAAPMLHLTLLAFGKKNYKIPLKAYIYLALCGVCSVLTMCICYYYAMMMTSAAVSAVLLYTAPIFVMLMSAILFKEKFTVKKVTALTLAFIGCALTAGIVGGIQGSAAGVLVGIAAGFAYSLYGILSTYALRLGVSPLACTAFSFTFAAIAALFITSPFKTVEMIALTDSPLKTILFMVLFSICTSVLPYILYTFGLRSVKPDIAAIAASTEPIVATLIGVFVLRQEITLFQIIGIFLVICAITLLNLNINKKPASK